LRSIGFGSAAAMVAARGGDTKDQSSTGGSASAGAGATAAGGAEPPKRGAIPRIRSSDNPTTFDLHQNISAVTTGPAAPMFNGLVQMNPQKDGDVIPDLAKALPQQPDEVTYVFTIPPDVKFHDGSILTAEDVKANYEWMLKPPAGKVSTRQAILAPALYKIETPDATTVRFTLKAPSATFPLNPTAGRAREVIAAATPECCVRAWGWRRRGRPCAARAPARPRPRPTDLSPRPRDRRPRG
jgi:ABC-type transport system substrate-binding protein